jgi:hypothetical protein
MSIKRKIKDRAEINKRRVKVQVKKVKQKLKNI